MEQLKRYQRLLELLEQQRELIEMSQTFSGDRQFEDIREEMVSEVESLIDLEPKDQITRSVMNKLVSRSNKGVRTYEKSMDRSDLSEIEWLCHLHEELMDGCLYNEKLIQEVRKRLQEDGDV